MLSYRRFILFAITLLPGLVHAESAPAMLSSPDHRIEAHFATAADGKLVYSVSYLGKPIIDESALALDLGPPIPLGAHVRIVDSTAGSGTDDYTLSNAKVAQVHDSYRSLTLRVEETSAPGRTLSIEARAYNDGFSFRYLLPAQPAMSHFELRQENTEFRFTTDPTGWLLALPGYRSSYESEYLQLPVSALGNQGGIASSFLLGLPALLHEPGRAWISLTEADVEGSTSMYLTNASDTWAGHWLRSRLAPHFDTPELAVTGTMPYHSAWRVIGIASEPGRLLESTLQYDLSPPTRLTDTSWVHAGKASWNWWSDDLDAGGKPAFTTENMKSYVGFAASSGIPYFMLDAGWSPIHDITKLSGKVDVPELVRYAAARNVKVWIWCYAQAVAEQMRDAFPLYEKWGVAGVKIDFINRDDQQGVQFYYDVARLAAEHHLMVDFHGTRTPWGLERTWPNVLSYEGILGLEQNKAGRRDSPQNRTVLAFTRMLTGPADYTPGGFNNVTDDAFTARNTAPMVAGTRAQQLALYVVLQSPFQMVSDSPQAYAGQPAFQFIRDVPVTWDSTRVLDGFPGEFIAIARSHGDEWYLGSITNWTARTLTVPLAFLGHGNYTAEIYEDSADAATEPTHVAIRKQAVTSRQSLTLHLAPGGGCAIRFVPRH